MDLTIAFSSLKWEEGLLMGENREDMKGLRSLRRDMTSLFFGYVKIINLDILHILCFSTEN